MPFSFCAATGAFRAIAPAPTLTALSEAFRRRGKVKQNRFVKGRGLRFGAKHVHQNLFALHVDGKPQERSQKNPA